MMIQPVVLCGGSGTRLWPLSREHYPKQLLALCGEHSLLQETVLRLKGLESQKTSSGKEVLLGKPLIISNEEHRFLVAEQLRQADTPTAKIVLEPIGRNTAPALTLAALAAVQQGDDPLLLVMPADHIIKNKDAFHQALMQGAELADVNHLVTFGVVPSAPETGYGYIKQGKNINGSASLIEQFVEKPDYDTAVEYLESGRFLWNSGMFMMKASVWLEAINRFQPEIACSSKQAFDNGNEDADFYRIDKAAFETCASDSIDYAVMEKITTSSQSEAALKSAVVPLDAEWSDVGSWDSLWTVSEQDENGNVLKGDVYTYNTKNSLVLSEHRLVTTAGLEDIIVVETADAVMVTTKDHAQHVKKLVESVKSNGHTQHQTHRKVYRPWGCYESVDSGKRFQVKRITVNPGASLSLQMHHHRAEHWVVVKGTAQVTKGEEVVLLTENESTYIPIGVSHRLENPGKLPLELIEVQSGSYLGEDDIVRYDDIYGRSDDGG